MYDIHMDEMQVLEDSYNDLGATVREVEAKANYTLEVANNTNQGFRIPRNRFGVQVVQSLNQHPSQVWHPDQSGTGGLVHRDIYKGVTQIIAYPLKLCIRLKIMVKDTKGDTVR